MTKIKNLSYYLNQSKKLTSIKSTKPVKIAILSSFTVNGLSETINVMCSEEKIDCMTYNAPYNQYAQEILNVNSQLYNFNPDITFLLLDTRSILGELFFDPYSISSDKRNEFIEKKSSELLKLLTFFSEHSKSILVTSNLQIPFYSPYGIYENKTDFGFKEMIDIFNKIITKYTKNNTHQFIFDINSFTSKFGEINVFNHKQYFSGDLKIALSYIPSLAYDFLGFIKPLLGKNKKCIVLDLDDTLWGGIIGEDGFDGIKLGPTPPGNSFVEFQKYLLSLHKRGIILAINSKNNFEDAMKVIREHPYMILKEDHFASTQINWNDKVSNIKKIASELNIGLDSLIFVDDDIVNREFMKNSLPQVQTIDLSENPSDNILIMQNLNDLNILKITEEDKIRGKIYFEQGKRNVLFEETSDLDDFLKELNIQINIKRADSFSIPRISQLTLKTNQFNLTTKRYQEKNIDELTIDENFFVGYVDVKDKFGNNGVTGVFIIEKNDDVWILDTFLMSCRVMGRQIEYSVMSYILNMAKQNKVKKIYADYIQTKKNQPCSSFLSNCGFILDNNRFVYDVKKSFKTPNHITIL
jgi:FkbH-like protein